MAITAFTGTVTRTALTNNFDDATATNLTNFRAGDKDYPVSVYVASLTSATGLSLRSHTWTQSDDQELRIIMARGTADASGRTLTATLTQTEGVTEFLVDNTISVSVASTSAAAFDTRTASSGDYRTVTGTRLRLVKGVNYTLTLSTDVAATWTNAQAVVLLRSIRRVA